MNAHKLQLRPDQVPSLHLPRSSEVKPMRKPPKERISPEILPSLVMEPASKEIGVQTEVSGIISNGDSEVQILKREVGLLKSK